MQSLIDGESCKFWRDVNRRCGLAFQYKGILGLAQGELEEIPGPVKRQEGSGVPNASRMKTDLHTHFGTAVLARGRVGTGTYGRSVRAEVQAILICQPDNIVVRSVERP